MADKSLIQFILDLLRDPKALADFKADPEGTMKDCGLAGVSPEDVHDALVLVQDNDDVDFNRDYHTGGNHVGGATVPPPPPPAHHGGGETGVHYLDKYVTNNYVTNNIDDRDTIIDQSVNQNIHAGGDVNQNFDNHSVNATGDGAVAAGGDIKDSTVTTGHGNVVGDDNKVVNGNDNTTAFGKGSAVHAGDISAKDGGAVSVGGNAHGEQTVKDSHNDTRIDDHSNHSTEHSFNDDSHNLTHTETNSHNETDLLSHNTAHVDIHPV